jgi:hypothetical protein
MPRSRKVELYLHSPISFLGIVLCSTYGEKRNAYKILMGKPERKRPLGGPRRRLEDNIKIDLKDVGWGGVDWIDLAQDRDRWRAFLKTPMNLLVP